MMQPLPGAHLVSSGLALVVQSAPCVPDAVVGPRQVLIRPLAAEFGWQLTFGPHAEKPPVVLVGFTGSQNWVHTFMPGMVPTELVTPTHSR